MQISIANAIGGLRGGGAAPPTPTVNRLIFTVDTTKTASGGSNADQYRLMFSLGAINATIYWGDGTSDVVTSTTDAALTHTYPSAGIYQIQVDPTDPVGTPTKNVRFGSGSQSPLYECLKLLSIDQWGATTYDSFIGSYRLANLDNCTSFPTTGPISFYLTQGTFWGGDSLANYNMDGYTIDGSQGYILFENASALVDGVNFSWSPTNLEGAFRYDGNFNGPLTNWDTSGCTTFLQTFLSASSFNQDIGGWDVSSGTTFQSMFQSASFFNQNIGGWTFNTSLSVDMSRMFYQAVNFNQDIGGWNTSNVNTMFQMFFSSWRFNNGGVGGVGLGIDQWDTSSVTTMGSMFQSATDFNQYIGSWNTSSVTTMASMFSQSSRVEMFNNGDAVGVAGGGVGLGMDNWDTSSVTDMSNMFSNAGAFNQYIGSWDVSNVTTFERMFYNVGSNGFDRDISNWNVSSCVNFYGMFWQNNPFTNDGVNGPGIGLDTWTINTTNPAGVSMTLMFSGTFQNWYLASWDTSNVTSMLAMFRFCLVFNPNYLGNWNISSLTNASEMLTGTALTTPNYDALLIGWAAQAPAIQSNVTLSVIPCQYTLAAQSAHDLLTGTYGWIIVDQGLAVTPTIFTVDTSQTATGSSAADQYQLTFSAAGAAIDATIYWGDGTNDVVTSTTDPALLHTYPSAGTYQIEIHATDPSVTLTTNPVFGSKSQGIQGECLKVTSIDQWGDCTYDSNVDNYHMSQMDNLTSLPAVGPVSMFLTTGTFWGISNLPNLNIDSYNVTGTADAILRESSIVDGVNFSWQPSQISAAFLDDTSFNGPLDNWDVSLVTNLSNTFNQATSFNQPLNVWDVSNVTTMFRAFRNAQSFNQSLNNWDVSSVADWNSAFIGARAFNQDIGSWNMSGSINLSSMLRSMDSFNNGDAAGVAGGGVGVGMDNWDVSGVNIFAGLFHTCTQFNQYIGSWNTSNATSFGEMFQNAYSFNRDIGIWNTSSATTMIRMFRSANVFNQDISGWNVSSVTDFSEMFYDALAFNQPIGSWTLNTTAVGGISLSSMFYSRFTNTSFDQDLSGWNVSNVNSFAAMFRGCTQMSAANFTALNSWNVTSVCTNLNEMFAEVGPLMSGFNPVGWDVSNVTAFSKTFYLCLDFNASNITSWNVGSSTYFGEMFAFCVLFNQDLGSWNVSSGTSFLEMFRNATSFNNGGVGGVGAGLDQWVMSSATSLNSMFRACPAFNQYIGSWDTSSVTDMRFMFNGASAFDQDLGGWNISSLTQASDMLTNTALSTANYDALLIGWAGQAPNVQNGVVLSTIPVNFTTGGAAEAGYNLLTGTYGWTIIDPLHP